MERDEKGDEDAVYEADTHVPAYQVAAHLKDSPRPQECEQSQVGHYDQHHVLPTGAPRLTHKNHYIKTNAPLTGKCLETVCLAAGNCKCLTHAIVTGGVDNPCEWTRIKGGKENKWKIRYTRPNRAGNNIVAASSDSAGHSIATVAALRTHASNGAALIQ